MKQSEWFDMLLVLLAVVAMTTWVVELLCE